MINLQTAIRDWQFFQPTRIVQRPGALESLPHWVPQGVVLLVTTAGHTRRGCTEQVRKLFHERILVYDQVSPNPDIDVLDEVARLFRDQMPTSIVALGGGSVMDASKALAALLGNEHRCTLSEILRENKSWNASQSLPIVAVPTTAGTGSEVTPFATIWDYSRHKKLSLANVTLVPKVAILDATLHLSLPRQETLYSGLDAVSHAVESLWNRQRTPVSEMYAARGLALAVKALPQVLANGDSLEGRSSMQLASLLAGVAIAQNRTALAHSISYPLTSHYSVPHGLAVSFTLPAMIQLVRRHHFFDNNAEWEPLFTETEKLLRSLQLESEITRFVSLEQALEKVPEMFAPGRADNFALEADEAMIRGILKNSF